MTTSTLGLIAGLLLGVAAAAGGFSGFLIALLLGVAGFLIGGQRDGEFDLSALLRGRNRD
jgi:D-aminopeptidase